MEQECILASSHPSQLPGQSASKAFVGSPSAAAATVLSACFGDNTADCEGWSSRGRWPGPRLLCSGVEARPCEGAMTATVWPPARPCPLLALPCPARPCPLLPALTSTPAAAHCTPAPPLSPAQQSPAGGSPVAVQSAECSALLSDWTAASPPPRPALPRLSGAAALYCTRRCTALHLVLHCTAPHCTSLSRSKLHCNSLHDSAQHCTAMYGTALHCTTLLYTALHCTALSCSGAPID